MFVDNEMALPEKNKVLNKLVHFEKKCVTLKATITERIFQSK